MVQVVAQRLKTRFEPVPDDGQELILLVLDDALSVT